MSVEAAETASGVRCHPFELIFAPFREARFPAIRAELNDRSDLDTFLLSAAALELMRELRPDDGLGDAVDHFVMLVHAAYLFWRDGEQTVAFDERTTRALCTQSFRHGDAPVHLSTVIRYVQVAPRLIWGQLEEDEPFEPLDGWFAIPVAHGLRVVACFGVHAERPGVSVEVAEGERPLDEARADGTPPFTPTMCGGDVAGLHAIGTPGELLLIGWRAQSHWQASLRVPQDKS